MLVFAAAVIVTACASSAAGPTPPGDAGAAVSVPASLPPRADSTVATRDRKGKPAPTEAASAPTADTAVLDSIDAAILDAIAAGVTPGAAIAVGRRGGLVRLRGYGNLDWAEDSPAVTDSSVYDLASLTKVVGTTTAVMLLTERGAMDLDAPLSRYLPAWPRGGWRDDVTVRRLLLHRAGLPPFVRFWHPSAGALRGTDSVVEAIVRLEPAYVPGDRLVYSDLGFILLGAAVEAVTGRLLAAFLDAEVWAPLAMEETGFLPLDRGIPLERIAPTEVDTVYRHVHVRGVVHDENAHAMGGVAGHAGLFSTASDLSRFAGMLLDGGRLGEVRVLRPGTLAGFTGRRPAAERALGWDLRSPSGVGAPLSDVAFGHTGFTGTSLWVDPEHDLYVVLLTNRVNPTRAQGGIGELRRTVHALAARAVGGAELDGSGNGDGEDRSRRLR